MNKLPIFLCLLFIPMIAFSQGNADGLYLEVEEERCYYSKLRLTNTKTFICVLDNPLIGVEDFKKVGPIKVDELLGTREFSIMMSDDGTKKLATMSKIYAGKNFAFVLEEEVICLMEVKGEIRAGKLTISETTNDSSLKRVVEILKADHGL